MNTKIKTSTVIQNNFGKRFLKRSPDGYAISTTYKNATRFATDDAAKAFLMHARIFQGITLITIHE